MVEGVGGLGVGLRWGVARASAADSADEAPLRARFPGVRGIFALDPWMFPVIGHPDWRQRMARALAAARVPAVLLTSTVWSESPANSKRMREFETEIGPDRASVYSFEGAGHHEWNDTLMYSPLVARALGMRGKLRPVDAQHCTAEMIDIFSRYAFDSSRAGREPFALPDDFHRRWPFVRRLAAERP